MCKLWWFKMLSRARSAMEWSHVWIAAEGKCSAMQFIWASRGRHFSKPEGAASSSASHEAMHKLHNSCWRLQQEREENPGDQRGDVLQGGQVVALPHLLLSAPAPACLMTMLLLTWVFPRAQAPFELFLLDSSQLLLLWPSETQLPPCPGSEREYVSIQSWVTITNSQQDLSCWEMMEPIEGKGNWLRKIRESLQLKRNHKGIIRWFTLKEREVRYFLPDPQIPFLVLKLSCNSSEKTRFLSTTHPGRAECLSWKLCCWHGPDVIHQQREIQPVTSAGALSCGVSAHKRKMGFKESSYNSEWINQISFIESVMDENQTNYFTYICDFPTLYLCGWYESEVLIYAHWLWFSTEQGWKKDANKVINVEARSD